MGMTTMDISRRGFLTGLGKAAMVGTGTLLLKPRPADADGTSWWQTLSQSQRNQEIVNRAWQEIGKYYSPPDGECKEWARAVVKYASVKHVNLPSNSPAPNDWYWQYDPSGHTSGQCMYIAYAGAGQIVQMKYSSNGRPHTAIVVANNGSRITFIASNDPYGSYTVSQREWTFADFHSKMSAYAVYTIR